MMKSFSEIVVNSETVLLHLLEGTEVIGSVMYNQSYDELYNLFIDIKHRGVGNAELLLKEAVFRYSPTKITASKMYGADPVRLIKLYSKAGFTVDNVVMVTRTE